MSRKSVLFSIIIVITISIPIFYLSSTPNSAQIELKNPEFVTASSTVIWHDDCSNISSFPDLADAWYNGAMGSIAAASGYIYPTSFGSSSGSHGPVYYHTFAPALTIGQFDWLEAEIEVDGSSAIGAAAIMLYDSEFNRVAILDVADSWSAIDETVAYAGWYDVDFNPAYTPKEVGDVVSEPYRETLRMEINSTGLYGLIPRIGDYKMLNVSNLELERDITYLCVQFRQKDSYTPCQTMRIHDIRMQYEIPVTTTSSTTTSTETSTTSTTTVTNTTSTTTTTMDYLSFAVLAITIGSIGVIIVVVAVICRSRSPGATSNPAGYNW